MTKTSGSVSSKLTSFLSGFMQLRTYSLIAACVLCASCTASTRNAVIARFPNALEINGFSYFHTELFKCTFAEVTLSEHSAIAQNLLDQTGETLDILRQKDAQDPFTRYEFPEGGFAYFQGRSIADVAGDFERAGDRTLGYDIGEEIFSAKFCWRALSEQGKWEQRKRYADIITNRDAIVVIGKEPYPTTIVYLPEDQRAYYFGP